MSNFNKAFKLKIVSIIIAAIFLLETAVYGIDLPKNTHLRVPIGDMDRLLEKLDKEVRKAMSPANNPRPRPIYNSMDNMLKGLNSEIPNKLKERGLNDADIDVAIELLDLVEDIYRSMGILTENYHNHVHNLAAAYTILLFTEDLYMSTGEIKAAFIAGLFHDFHVRVVVDSETRIATPALVEETLRQLADILEIEKYQGRAVKNARYEGEGSMIGQKTKNALRDTIVKFLGGVDLTKQFYPAIAAMIRRSDFPSNVTAPHQAYKQKALLIKSVMDKAMKTGEKITEVIRLVNTQYDGVYDALHEDTELNDPKRADTKAWLDRQKGIEIAYLEDMGKWESRTVFRRDVLLFHALAHRLEKGSDQAGYYYLATPEMVEREITPGLSKEVPGVEAAGSYPFFFSVELLEPSALGILSVLPLEYKDNFCRVMGHYASLSTNVGLAMKNGVPVKEIFEKAETDWRAREEKIAYMMGMSQRLLRNSLLGGFFGEEEMGRLISNVEINLHNADTILIEQGEEPGEVGVGEILSGEAEVIIDGELVAVMTKGSIFGEIAIINNTPRTATVVARKGSIIAEIDSELFRDLYENNKDFKRFLSSLIESRLIKDELRTRRRKSTDL